MRDTLCQDNGKRTATTRAPRTMSKMLSRFHFVVFFPAELSEAPARTCGHEASAI